MIVCPVCGCRQRDGLLCRACTRELDRDLAAVPGLLAELDTTLAKLARTAPPGPGGLALERTGYHAGASTAKSRLTTVLTAWAAGTGHRTWYATTAAAALRADLPALRAHPQADKLHREITGAVDHARRVIGGDHAAVIDVGPCPDCDARVTAHIPADDHCAAWMECGGTPAHRWDTHQWYRAGRRILAKRGAT